MANSKADIRILVGAEGGATSGGDLIKKELKAYFKDGIKIKVNLDDVSIGSIKAKISDQIASGQSKAANTALNNEFKLYNAQQRRIAQERMYENINISIKGHGDARLKQLGQQYALMEKSSDAAKKIAKQEYIAYNNQQRMLAQERMYANIDASVSGDLKNDKNYQDLKKYFTELEKVSAAEAKRDANIARRTETINSRARSQMASFKQYLQTLNPRVLSEHMAEADLILEDFKDATISVGDEAVRSFEKGANGVKDFKAEMKNLGAEGGNIFTYLHGKLKTFIVYLASSGITMGVVSGIKNMISTVRDLDKALTDLRIVTGDSKSAAQELLSTYNEMAQVLGSTTSVVAKSADDWLRQGYNLVDTNQLIKDSMVLSIVGQMDSAEATSSLTAAMKGYSLGASEAIGIVDKFTRVDLEAATSAGHLATALSKTAANAKISGLSLNEVIGQLAVVNETMKEAGESTGTFYNTMLSRMGSIKSGELVDPESAESLSDVETTLSRLGIALRDSAGEFRNFGDVLDDVGRRWETFSLVDQRAIAQSFGGTRQQTRFFALMEGWEQAQKYSEAAANSAGTAMEKFGAYQESLEAKQNRLTASFERFSQSIIDSGLIGTFLDIQTALFNFGASVPDVIKNITMLTTAVLATAAAIKAISVSSLGKAIGGTFTRLYASLRGLPEVLSSMKSGVLSLGEALEYLNINKLAFGIGSAVAIGYGLYKLIDWLHVSLDEQKQNLAELSQNYKELQSQIGDVNDELSTTRDRINELNSIETLSIAEESELQMLQKTNDALATQISLLEKKIAIEERRLGDEIVETFRSEFGDGLNLTQSAIDQYVVDIPIVLNLTADESNISAMLAARKILQDFMISADSLEDFDYYKEYIDDVDLSLIASAETLGDYKSKLEALIKLTPEQTEVLLDITEALDLINKYLSPENLSIDEAGDAASQGIVKEYQDILQEAHNLGVDLSKTTYGNIDTNSRQILEWTEDNLSAYKEAIESWGSTVDEMRGSFSTVFGGAEEFDGVEIAFSPILQTDSGAVLLTRDTVYQYINNLIDSLGEGWTNEDLLALDIKGIEIDGQHVKGLIADIGETAIKTSEAMHFTGNTGAVQDAFSAVEDAANAAGMSVQAFIDKYGSSPDETNSFSEGTAKTLSNLKTAIDAYKSVQSDLANNNEISVGTLESLLSTYSDLDDVISNYLKGAATESDILDELEQKYRTAADAVGYTKDITEELVSSTTELIDSVQSALKSLQSAQDEYNETGFISVDLVQELLKLGPEYLSTLIDEKGQISLNSKAVASLISEKTAYLKTLAAEQVASYATSSLQSAMAKTTKDVGSSANDAVSGIEDATRAMMDMSANAISAAAGVSALDEALNKLADQQGAEGIDLEAWKQDVIKYANFVTLIVNSAGNRISGWTGATSSSSKQSKYVVDIERFRDALHRIDELSRKINTSQAKIDLVDKNDVAELERYTNQLIALYSEQQKALHRLNNERDSAILEGANRLRTLGFNVEYDPKANSLFIKNLELLNKLGSNLKPEAANKYRKEIEDLIKSITEWNKENIDGSLEWLRIQKSISDLLDESQDRKLDLIKEQRDGLNDVIDLTKQLIKQEQNDIIDALKSQTDKYREIVELKKRSLQLTKDERSYQDSVDSKNTEISKLQARIDALSLDDSREAQSQRASLLEQLAEKQKELTDIQTDYSDEKQQEALDSEIDRFEDTQDAKIAEIKKFLDNNHALTKAAMARIDRQGDALFKDLLRYSLHYTNTTEAELTSMWANAKSAVEEYGSAMRALETINARVDIAENKSGASSASKNAVVAQMKANSEAWWSADESEKNRLANLNKILGSSLGATIDKGVWWLNGKKLYDHTFHTGTPSAGRIPTPKQNELWALVEKGESVLTENQQNGLLGMFKNLTSNLNISGDLTAIASSMLSSLKGASNGVASVDASIRIEGPVSLDEEMKSFIKRYPKLVAEEVNKVLAKA